MWGRKPQAEKAKTKAALNGEKSHPNSAVLLSVLSPTGGLARQVLDYPVPLVQSIQALTRPGLLGRVADNMNRHFIQSPPRLHGRFACFAPRRFASFPPWRGEGPPPPLPSRAP